jgi:hypothetical protein
MRRVSCRPDLSGVVQISKIKQLDTGIKDKKQIGTVPM